MNNTYYYHWGAHLPMQPGVFFGLGALGIGLTALVLLAVLALKGYALWHAAKRDQKGWFIALLVVNSFGILELIYLYAIVKVWNWPFRGSRHAHTHEHHNHEHPHS
jgi:hypothetical protein